MKNAVILHGTGGSSRGNWIPWLKERLEKEGWKVWTPDLPGAEAPNISRYNGFLLSGGWGWNDETVLIGHSSGAVEILGLLPALPQGVRIQEAILVGSFIDDLGREDLKGLFETPFDFTALQSRARKFLLIHSDNDPFCPLTGAHTLAEKLNGELVVLPGQDHFSFSTGGEKHKEFPYLWHHMESI